MHTHTHTPNAHSHSQSCICGRQTRPAMPVLGGRQANPIRLQSRLLNKLRHRPCPDLPLCPVLTAPFPYSPSRATSPAFYPTSTPSPFLPYVLSTSRRFSPLHLLAKPQHVLRLLISVQFLPFCCLFPAFWPPINAAYTRARKFLEYPRNYLAQAGTVSLTAVPLLEQ